MTDTARPDDREPSKVLGRERFAQRAKQVALMGAYRKPSKPPPGGTA